MYTVFVNVLYYQRGCYVYFKIDDVINTLINVIYKALCVGIMTSMPQWHVLSKLLHVIFINKITESRSDRLIVFSQEESVDWEASISSWILLSRLPPFLTLSNASILHLTGWSGFAEQKGSEECVGAAMRGIHDLVGGNLSLESELNCRPNLELKRLCW